MSTDLYKQVNFNDGEGITHTDFNDVQRFLEAKIWEQIIHNSLPNVSTATANRDPQFSGQDGADHPTSRCYCLNPGSAYLRQGSANNKIQLAPGTLLQKLAVLTGDDPQIVAYTFAGTEEWTLVNGDATNPRVDLLEMKLEWITGDSQSRDLEDATTRVITTTSYNKKRRVQCTLQVKQGTAAASPQCPDPDTGFVPVGAAYVGATWTSAGNAPLMGVDTSGANVSIWDLRFPLGVRSYRVDPTVFKTVTAWALSTNNSSVTTSAGTNLLLIPCPHVNTGRLLGLGVTHFDAGLTPSGYNLGCSTGLTSTTFVPIASFTNLTNGGASTVDDIYPWQTLEATMINNAGGAVVTQSTTNKIGAPIWTSGRRMPVEKMRLTAAGSVLANHLVLRLQNSNNVSVVGPVTFYVAEGL